MEERQWDGATGTDSHTTCLTWITNGHTQRRELYSVLSAPKCEGNPGKREIGKSGKEAVYIQPIHFVVRQKLTQYCKATILQFFKKEILIKGRLCWIQT